MGGPFCAAQSSAAAHSSAEVLQQAGLHQAIQRASHIRLSIDHHSQLVLHLRCIRLSVELHGGLWRSSGC